MLDFKKGEVWLIKLKDMEDLQPVKIKEIMEKTTCVNFGEMINEEGKIRFCGDNFNNKCFEQDYLNDILVERLNC